MQLLIRVDSYKTVLELLMAPLDQLLGLTPISEFFTTGIRGSKSPGVSNNGSHITWITPNHMHWNGPIHILNVSKYIVSEREKVSLP